MRIAVALLACGIALVTGKSALADTYHLVTFDELTPPPLPTYPDPVYAEDVEYPFAGFGGGVLLGTPGSNIDYGTFDVTGHGNLSNFLAFGITPGYVVHEVDFDVIDQPFGLPPDLYIDYVTVDGYTHDRMEDLESYERVSLSSSVPIEGVVVYWGPGVEYNFAIDNIAFNPQAAVAATPEPGSLWLTLGGFTLGIGMLWCSRLREAEAPR